MLQELIGKRVYYVVNGRKYVFVVDGIDGGSLFGHSSRGEKRAYLHEKFFQIEGENLIASERKLEKTQKS